MAIEAKIGNELSLDQIEGRSFRVPSISKGYDSYHLDNQHLLSGFENSLSTISDISPELFCKNFNFLYGENINGQVLYDPATNIITEIHLDFPKIQSSRVSLDQSFGSRSGTYKSENIRDLSVAILYQKFLSKYLSSISNSQKKYAYINQSNEYSSQYLGIPDDIVIPKDKDVTNERFRENVFWPRANWIAGQFSTPLSYISYTKEGLIQIIQADSSKDCHYCLARREYFAHNVDNAFEAATLHGIVAEYINEIINRKN